MAWGQPAPQPSPSPAPPAQDAATNALPAADEQAPAGSPAPTPTPAPTDSDIAPHPVPDSEEEAANIATTLQARLDEVSPQLEQLRAADHGAGKPLLDALTALSDTLRAASEQLAAYREALRSLADLTSPERQQERADRLQKARLRTEELKVLAREGPRYIYSDSQLYEEQAEVAKEYEAVSGETWPLVNKQSNWQNALTQLPQQEQEATAALNAARAALDDLHKARVEGTPAPAAPPGEASPAPDVAIRERARPLKLERAAWEVFQASLRLKQLDLQKRILDLQLAASESKLAVMRPYAQVLADYRSRVDKLVASSEISRIEPEIARAQSPAEKAYWELRLRFAQIRQDFTTRLETTRRNFRGSERESIQRQMSRDRQYYQRLLDRLDRTSGEEKIADYRRLEEIIAGYEGRLARLNLELDTARRGLDELQNAEAGANDSIEAARETLRQAVQDIKDPEQRQRFDQLRAELATDYRPKVEAAMTEAVNAQNTLVNLRKESAESIAQLIEQLRLHREELYWSYTLARGPNFWKTVQAGATEARGPLVHPLRQAWAEEGAAWPETFHHRRTFVIVFLLLLICGALLARRRIIRSAERREKILSAHLEEKSTAEIAVTDRAKLTVLRFVASALPVGAPAGALLLLILTSFELPPRGAAILRDVLVLVVALTLGWAVIHSLFESGKARFRLLPCSNVVAGRYRFWLTLIWLWNALCLLPFVALRALEIGSDTVAALWSIYAAGAIILTLLFVRDRQNVLRVVGRAYAQRHPRGLAMVARAYPLLFFFLVALLVLLAMGYVAFMDYIVRGFLQLIAAVAVGILLSQILAELVRKHGGLTGQEEPDKAAEPVRESPKEHDFDEVLLATQSREAGLLLGGAATLAHVAIWVGVIVWIAAAWGVTWNMARRVLHFPLLARGGEQPVTVARIVIAVVIFVVAFKISRFMRAFLTSQVYPAYGHVNKAAQATINTLLHYTVIVLGLYIALQVLRVNFAAIAVLLGGLGLGIGLGLQPLVVNFISGLIIFAERHVKVGDVVNVGADTGEVTGISMRSTLLRTADGIDVIIPNSEFVTSRVTNWTLNDTRMRGSFTVRVAYGSDISKVRRVLREIADREPRVLGYPEPAVWLTDFGEYALEFTVACWFPSPGDRWSGMIEMRYQIDRRFREEGIEIPLPQQTLSMAPGSELPIRVSRRDERHPPGEPGPNGANGETALSGTPAVDPAPGASA